MQTVKQKKQLKPKLNSWVEPTPSTGDIWQDADGHYNLIIDIFEDDGYEWIHSLCLDNGNYYPREPIESWREPQGDGRPYYRKFIG